MSAKLRSPCSNPYRDLTKDTSSHNPDLWNLPSTSTKDIKPQNPETQWHRLRYSQSSAEKKAGVSDLPKPCASTTSTALRGEGGLRFWGLRFGFRV